MFTKYTRHHTHHLSRAFTIVELMIVIVVIGVLVTISFVSYRGVQQRAEVVVTMNDLANLSDEMQVFYKDNGRYPYVFPPVGTNTLPELEQILKTTGLYEDTRNPEPKKTFTFCAPTKSNPQRYAIVASKLDEGTTGTPATTLYYVTSDHSPSSTPMVWTDAITNADPASKYGSNACNSVNLKTGTSYFNTYVVRWSFNVPEQL